MDSSHIELKGSQVVSVKLELGSLRVRFDPALIVKTMTGSRERTLWRQAGTVVFEGAELFAESLSGPQRCSGGEMDANIYSYRDLIPIPFASRGQVRCRLWLEGRAEPLTIAATAVRLELEDVPKYIEHIRP